MGDTVVLVHAAYREPGGEDATVAREARLLRQRGHRVVRFGGDNARLKVADVVRGGPRVRDGLLALLRRERPSVAHVHNTFPALVPAVYDACRIEGVPVVQSVHNFRLACAAIVFVRDGRDCRDCAGKPVPWPALAHRCYGGSRLATAGAVVVQLRQRRAWASGVERFVAPSAFAARTLADLGLPHDRIDVVPPLLDPPPLGGGGEASEPRLLFAGRLTTYKGVEVLAAAAGRAGAAPIDVAGDGPMRAALERSPACGSGALRLRGHLDSDEVRRRMAGAVAVVVPSIAAETFGLVAAEALLQGVPVVSSDAGALPELVHDGVNGLVVPAGDVDALAGALRRLSDDAELRGRLAAGARASVEALTDGDRAYERLMEVFDAARR